ncbi:MAG TPA: trypsin-like peptidase domain-containing protein [Humisphaera sp.]|jgi:serine protease Do|nr:trypsin-like peptidase domain-containing protein [Humisphaera sp.]
MGSRANHGVSGGAAALIGFLCVMFWVSAPLATAGDAPPLRPPREISDNFNVIDLEQHFQDVAQHVASSVVAICGTDARIDADNALRSDHITTEQVQKLLQTVDRTVGTGFVVDSDGYIATNDHVVTACDQLWVTMDDHKIYPAIVVGSDPRSDIAVLKIPATNLPVIHFASAAARRGQWSIALGNPWGLSGGGEMSLSVGVISAIDRSLPRLSSKEDRLYYDLIQTTAQINPGNSGGPLFDLEGNVIGINTAVILPQKVTNGIGFAIPITPHVCRVINDLKTGREISYGFLGVRVSSPTPAERRDAGISGEVGAKIDFVEPASPAERAKLQAGDILTAFNGQTVRDGDQFVRLVGEASADQSVSASFQRGSKPVAMTLQLGHRPIPTTQVTTQTQRFHWRGMVLGPVPKNWNIGATTKVAEGLIVLAIDAQSPAAKSGIVQGAIIKSIGGKAVSDISALQLLLNSTPPDECAIECATPTVASARD